MPTALRRTPLAEQAAAAILGDLRGTSAQIGSKLPSEAALAEQFGVGRSTVREAIRQLAGRGVLESRQGSGVYVVSLEPVDDWTEIIREAPAAAVLEARLAVEVEAAGFAAARRTPAELRTIRRLLRARIAPELTYDERVDADLAFHAGIIAAAHSEVLAELFATFAPRVRATTARLLRDGAWRPDDAAQHAAIVEAIAAKDADAARQSSRAHLAGLLGEHR